MKSSAFYTLALLGCMAVGSAQGMSDQDRERKLCSQFGRTLEKLADNNDFAGIKKLYEQDPTIITRLMAFKGHLLLTSSIYRSLACATKHNNVDMVQFIISTSGLPVLSWVCRDAAQNDTHPAILDYIVTQLQAQHPESWQHHLGCALHETLTEANATQRLINAGADVNTHLWGEDSKPYDPTYVFKTPLHTAVGHALRKPLHDNPYVPTIKLLLAKGARTDIKDKDGKTVRDLCEIQGKYKDTLRALRDLIIAPKKEILDIRDTTRFPLVLATIIADYAFSDDQELLDACEECAKDPMARRVQHLLESGCNPNVTNTNGKGTLAYAAQCGNAYAIQLLLSHKANILMTLPKTVQLAPVCDEHGTTPLHHASEQGSPEVVELLISAVPGDYRKALVNAQTTYTTVHNTGRFRFGGRDSRKAAVKYRFNQKTGKVENVAEVAGTTPLMAAAGYGHPEVVKLLLQRGADKNMRDAHDKSALEYVKDSEIIGNVQKQCLELLS